MMVWILRIPLLLVFALHWGGLTFYTGFVVRISHDVLNDPIDGGLITQRVTTVLNLLAVVSLGLMVANGVDVLRRSRKLGYALVGCAALAGLALIGLFVVHGHLDAVIDAESYSIIDRDAFTAGHRRYNQLTTLQWLASLAYVPITVLAWKSIDAEGD